MHNEERQLEQEKRHLSDLIKENKEKLKNNKQLPYLVASIVELLDNSDPILKED